MFTLWKIHQCVFLGGCVYMMGQQTGHHVTNKPIQSGNLADKKTPHRGPQITVQGATEGLFIMPLYMKLYMVLTIKISLRVYQIYIKYLNKTSLMLWLML